MKLATFTTGAVSELGAVIGHKIVPLNRVLPQLPRDMIGLIQSWPAVEAAVRAAAGAATMTLDLDQVRLLAPIRRPGKIMAGQCAQKCSSMPHPICKHRALVYTQSPTASELAMDGATGFGIGLRGQWAPKQYPTNPIDFALEAARNLSDHPDRNPSEWRLNMSVGIRRASSVAPVMTRTYLCAFTVIPNPGLAETMPEIYPSGVITKAVIDGFASAFGQDHAILVSPRSAETAEALARDYSHVTVAADNQA
eukprot:gene111-162_t